ncbi:MAG: hypothetical protein ACKV2V_11170 [Blastocatellia bacterium]
MNLCLVTAADIEFRTIARLTGAQPVAPAHDAPRVWRACTPAHEITLLQCGVGAIGFAGQLQRHLQKTKYDALLIPGLGGGLDPALGAGDTVLYEKCHLATAPASETMRQAPPYVTCDGNLLAAMHSIFDRAGLPCARGAGITTEHIVTTAREKQRLREETGAAVVDMESYMLLEICGASGVPAAVMRVISDTAARDLPDFNRALDARGHMSTAATTLALLQKPVAAAHFLRGLPPVLRAFEKSVSVLLSAEWCPATPGHDG